MDLILSDLHSNLQALKVVERFARRRGVRRYVVLGDLVGYGAHPNQVLDRVRKMRPRFLIRGNHDKVCCGLEPPAGFSLPARQSAEWTLERLRKDHRRFLRDLPEGPGWVGEDYQIAHGSPLDEDAYLLNTREALLAFEGFQSRLCFFGHTHLPGLYELDEERHRLTWLRLEADVWFTLRPGCRYLANPGSLGQPRDRDQRLSFMTYDPRKARVRLHRLEYDWAAAAEAIEAAGLHMALAERLRQGI
ncbi:MAG TPA: metallophosphoesterase family protein [Holophagaceae bacterium]|nr:metallophosphoesterase family protein [Holophagaceae bacterium]